MIPLSMNLSNLWTRFQGHNIFWSRISEKRRILKVTIAQEEKYLTYGMVLYLVTLTNL